MNEDLKIRVSGLTAGPHDYHMSVNAAPIGLSENFTHPIEVDAHLEKNTRQLFLHVDLHTTAQFECDRCLEAFENSLHSSYSVVYLYDEGESAQYPPEEVQIIAPDTVTIDLTDDVRQMVALSVPMKLLCREECKGLCPQCGTNWNIKSCSCRVETKDPRWEQLQKFMKQ